MTLLGGVLSTFVSVAVIVVICWVALWGVAGFLVAQWRGRSRAVGFVLGAVLGPIGLVLVLIGDLVIDRVRGAEDGLDEPYDRSDRGSGSPKRPILDL